MVNTYPVLVYIIDIFRCRWFSYTLGNGVLESAVGSSVAIELLNHVAAVVENKDDDRQQQLDSCFDSLLFLTQVNRHVAAGLRVSVVQYLNEDNI